MSENEIFLAAGIVLIVRSFGRRSTVAHIARMPSDYLLKSSQLENHSSCDIREHTCGLHKAQLRIPEHKPTTFQLGQYRQLPGPGHGSSNIQVRYKRLTTGRHQLSQRLENEYDRCRRFRPAEARQRLRPG